MRVQTGMILINTSRYNRVCRLEKMNFFTGGLPCWLGKTPIGFPPERLFLNKRMKIYTTFVY